MSAVYVCIYDLYTCTYISWYINVYAQKYMHILICRITDGSRTCDVTYDIVGDILGVTYDVVVTDLRYRR